MKRHHHNNVTDAERLNLASDYNYGRANSTPELGYPSMTLDEYVLMVRGAGKCAVTFDRSKRTPEEEIDDILSKLG